jgi:Immunity protein 8
MLSEVRNIMSTEIFDLENYRPDDHENFSFSLTITVGPLGEAGGDLFDIDVCTPKWLLARQDDDIVLGKGKIIVYRCDMKMILKRVSALFEGCIGKDWNDIAIKLSRVGHWEFENYQQ